MICPHCMVTVRFDFEWGETYPFPNYSETKIVYQINSALCPNCNDLVVIVVHGQGGLGQGEYFLDVDEDFQEQVVFPIASTAPMPTADMPEEIQNDYLEARAVFDASPRAAAALLRLCVQKLMPLLGEKGKNINDDIASLVTKGLPIKIQQALDTLRVIGNESVHPGEINLNDDRETAFALFGLMNFIVESMITQPKEIEKIYKSLPDSKREGITKRDGK